MKGLLSTGPTLSSFKARYLDGVPRWISDTGHMRCEILHFTCYTVDGEHYLKISGVLKILRKRITY